MADLQLPTGLLLQGRHVVRVIVRHVWMPPSQPIEIGVARFYHRQWPSSFTAHDLFVPFGAIVHDDAGQDIGPTPQGL